MDFQSAACCISSAIHVCWIASAACFQRAASPSLLGRMVESAMPLLGVLYEGKVNACPKLTHWCQRLRQCVNPLPEQMTILPNHSGE